jgi:Tfp pilus assembly protein PilF
VNPSRLDHAARDSVCNQCHLHGEIRIPRAGRDVGDFRPGEHLEDVLAVLVQPAPPREAGALRAVSQVEQMASSTCYRESSGALGCISCHDPHRATPRDERDRFYSQRCLACHSERGCALPESERHAPPANDSCVHCHMPRTSAGGIPHTAQTDHRIMRRSAPPTAATARDIASLTFFGDSVARLPEWEQSRARGIMLLELGSNRSDRAAVAAQAESLLQSALAQAPGDAVTLHYLGTACVRQGRPNEARDWWEQTLEIEPARLDTLLAHAVVCEALGDRDKSARSFERLVRLSPWQADAFVRYAGLLFSMENWETAVQMAGRAVEIDPTQLEARRILAEACARAGKRAESRRQVEIIEKMLKATSN